MTDNPRAVLDQILESVQPASRAQRAHAEARLSARHGGVGDEPLYQLAAVLCGMRHSPAPCVDQPVVVVCAADHGVADPGVDFGANSPALEALRCMSRGEAAINAVVRSCGARLVLVDCGVRGGRRHGIPAGVVDLSIGEGSWDISRGPAMSPVDCVVAIQRGVAALFAIAEEGLDVLALGHLGVGSELVASALVAVMTGTTAEHFDAEDVPVIRSALDVNRPRAEHPVEVLTGIGGYEHAVMVGMILAAAAIHVPILLDDHGTSVAALVAARLCPPAAEYVLAAHAGRSQAHRLALAALSLQPLFTRGLAHGEGSGSALAIPFVQTAASLVGSGRG